MNATIKAKSAPGYFFKLLRSKGIKCKKHGNQLIVPTLTKDEYVRVMNLGFDVYNSKTLQPTVRPMHVLATLFRSETIDGNVKDAHFSIRDNNGNATVTFLLAPSDKDVKELGILGKHLSKMFSSKIDIALDGVNSIKSPDVVYLNKRLKKTLGFLLDISKYHRSELVRDKAFEKYSELLAGKASIHPAEVIEKGTFSRGFRNLLNVALTENHEHRRLAKLGVITIHNSLKEDEKLPKASKVTSLTQISGDNFKELNMTHKRIMGEYERNTKLH